MSALIVMWECEKDGVPPSQTSTCKRIAARRLCVKSQNMIMELGIYFSFALLRPLRDTCLCPKNVQTKNEPNP
jgi:hypothetical protein